MTYTTTVLMVVILSNISPVLMTDCTPPGQTIITCSHSNKSGICDKANELIENIEPISKVTVFQPHTFVNPDTMKIGVTVTWKPPTADDAQKTKGFIFKLYYYSSATKFLEECRFYNVSVTGNVTDEISQAANFTFQKDSLNHLDKEYRVEITTTPHSNQRFSSPAIKTFFTLSSLLPEVTTLPPYSLNASFNTSVDFGAISWFRTTGYYPHHRAQYKHTKYNVSLLHANKTHVTTLKHEEIKIYEFFPPIEEEYLQVNFSDLHPGMYRLDVTPYYRNTFCPPEFCNIIVDGDNVEISQAFAVTGPDYGSDSTKMPTLEIFSNNSILITFWVAPAHYLITQYDIIVTKAPNGVTRLKLEYDKSAQETWHEAQVVFSTSDVKKLFHYPNSLQVEVVPTFISTLCNGEAGMCNIHGTCEPCTKAVSPFKQLKKPSSINVTVIGVCAAGVVLLLVLTIFLVIRRRINSGGKCLCDKEKGDNGGNYQKLEKSSVTRPKICLAYVSENTYDLLYESMRQALELHFNCDVITYTGTEDRTTLNDCNYVLVMYSWPLLQTLLYFKNLPPHVQPPRDQIHAQKVLDLLVKPQPLEFPKVLMAVFDHVPVPNRNELMSRSSEATLFALPSQVKQLVAYVHKGSHDNPHYVQTDSPILQKAYLQFESSPEAAVLNKAIDDVAKYDSGFETMSLNTVYSKGTSSIMPEDENPPESQNSNVEVPANNERVPYIKQAAASAHQVPKPASKVPPRAMTGTDRTITLTPHAEEAQFFQPRLESLYPNESPESFQSPATANQLEAPVIHSYIDNDNNIQLKETVHPNYLPTTPAHPTGTYPDFTTVYTQQESEASSGLHSSSLPRSISGIESDECCSVDTNDSAMLSNEPLSMDKMVTDSLDCSTINFSTDVSSRFSSKFEEAPARIYHF